MPLSFNAKENYTKYGFTTPVSWKPSVTFGATKPDGAVQSETKQPTAKQRQMTAKECTQIIYNQISRFSKPENTKKILKSTINKNNVLEILAEYKNMYKTSLTRAINDEYFLDFEDVKSYIVYPLIQKARDLKIDLKPIGGFDDLKNLTMVNQYIEKITQLIENVYEGKKNLELAKQMQEQYKKPDFNPNEYTLEALKKKYPESDYNITAEKGNDSGRSGDYTYTTIKITTKQGTPAFEIETNTYDYGDEYKYITEYDKSGRVTKHFTALDNSVCYLHTSEYDLNTINQNDTKPKTLQKDTYIDYHDNGKVEYLKISYNDTYLGDAYSFHENGNLQRTYTTDEKCDIHNEKSYNETTGILKSDNEYDYHPNGMIKRKGNGFDYSESGIKLSGENLAGKLHDTASLDFRLAFKELTTDNIIDVLNQVNNKFGKDLSVIIRSSRNLTTEEKLDYINKLTTTLKSACHYNDNYRANSRIENKYYKGDRYTVKFTGLKAVIINQDKKIQRELNLNTMLSSMKESDKIIFAATIQKLPGEILMNIAKECNKIYNRRDCSELFNKIEKFTTGLFYSHSLSSAGFAEADTHTIHISNSKDNISHELAHLIDFFWGGTHFSWNRDETRAFSKEKSEWIKHNNHKNLPYFLENTCEFFAETIAALTLNDEIELERIKTACPKTFDLAIKCYKEYMRNG